MERERDGNVSTESYAPQSVDMEFSFTADMDWFELESLITVYSADTLRRTFNRVKEMCGDFMSDDDIKAAIHRVLFSMSVESRGQES